MLLPHELEPFVPSTYMFATTCSVARRAAIMARLDRDAAHCQRDAGRFSAWDSPGAERRKRQCRKAEWGSGHTGICPMLKQGAAQPQEPSQLRRCDLLTSDKHERRVVRALRDGPISERHRRDVRRAPSAADERSWFIPPRLAHNLSPPVMYPDARPRLAQDWGTNHNTRQSVRVTTHKKHAQARMHTAAARESRARGEARTALDRRPRHQPATHARRTPPPPHRNQ